MWVRQGGEAYVGGLCGRGREERLMWVAYVGEVGRRGLCG